MKKYTINSTWLIFLIGIILMGCTKKEIQQDILSNKGLIGVWIVETEFSSNGIHPDEFQTYNCNNVECHTLIFTKSTYEFRNVYEYYSDSYDGEYELQGNRIVCIKGG